jgi:uncharacterized delta-60 repeat protein
MGPDGFVSAVAITPGGFIAAGGTFTMVDGLPFNRVTLLEATGTPASFFSASSGLNAEVYYLTAQPNGRLLLTGGFSQPTRGIARLQPGGAVDPSFSPGAAANAAVHWALVQPDGMIVIGGAFSEVAGEVRRGVARLTADGFVDTSFTGDALSGGTVFSIARQSDGRLVVVGDFTVGGNPVNIARLNTDGTLDSSFNPGSGANATVYAVALQSTGGIVLGGDFTTINGTNRNRIARLTTTGALDLSFDPGRGANNTVFSIVILPNDDIVLGGDFSRMTGVARSGVARLRGGVAPFGAAFMASSLNGGTARFTASVQAGSTYVIEASNDLTHWTPVSTNTAVTAVLEFTDTTVHQHGARFFRVRRAN